MDDLIKRSDAIEAIEVVDWYHQNRNKDMVSGANSADHQAWYKAEDIYKALEEVPSADRPQGEWIWSPRDTDGTLSGCCSNCSFSHLFIGGHTAQYNYCPNCGADMRKGADDE